MGKFASYSGGGGGGASRPQPSAPAPQSSPAPSSAPPPRKAPPADLPPHQVLSMPALSPTMVNLFPPNFPEDRTGWSFCWMRTFLEGVLFPVLCANQWSHLPSPDSRKCWNMEEERRRYGKKPNPCLSCTACWVLHTVFTSQWRLVWEDNYILTISCSRFVD